MLCLVSLFCYELLYQILYHCDLFPFLGSFVKFLSYFAF